MKRPPIDLAALVRDLLKIVEDFENFTLLAHAKTEHIPYYKEFAALARPILDAALLHGLTESPARRILMGMKHISLATKGVIWHSAHGNVPDFFATRTRLAEALEFSQIPFQREVPA